MQRLTKSIIFSGLLLLVISTPAYGISPFQFRQQTNQENQGTGSAIQNQITNQARRFRRAILKKAIITAIEGTTIITSKDNQSYTILTGTFSHCTTKLVRRFGAASNLGEYSVGDELSIHGRWQNQDESTKTIEACLIRNHSIQKRHAVFVGEILELTSAGFKMSTVGQKRPDQTINVNTETQYVDRQMQAIKYENLQVGHRVRVKGIWNNDTNIVNQVAQVKDFSLPVRPTPQPSVNPTTE